MVNFLLNFTKLDQLLLEFVRRIEAEVVPLERAGHSFLLLFQQTLHSDVGGDLLLIDA